MNNEDMTVLAYTISSQLRNNLKIIDIVRSKIHLYPLSHKSELRFRWEALAEKVYWSLILAEVPVSKESVIKTLSNPPSRKMNVLEKEILDYKKALDYIRYEWLGISDKVTHQSIKKLYDLACKPTLGSSDITFKSKRASIDRFLEYLQTGQEHPIVQAGVSYIETYMTSPFTEAVGRLARLVAYLFLYKHGYDFRGLLVFDEFMRKDLIALRAARETVTQRNTLTLWLEYWAYGIGTQAENAFKKISSGAPTSHLPPALLKINARQKEIILYMDNPESKITNRQVQKRFKVSQITASRDLSKLTNLGLLARRGKGRSHYYIRGELI